MNRAKVIAAALLVLLVVGCDSGKPDNYYPMGAGSTWSYETWATLEITAASVETTATGTTEVEVTGIRQLTSGEDVTEFVTIVTSNVRFPAPDTIVVHDTQYVRDAGDFVLAFDALDDAVPDTLLVLPLVAGRSWHADDSAVVTVEQQEGVTVEAGSFPDAWRLSVDNGSGFEIKQWFANHVGLVKMSFTGEPQSGYKVELHNELVSSDVKE
ncbi:MAG: hypothetical protein R6X13_02305 [bacterium]